MSFCARICRATIHWLAAALVCSCAATAAAQGATAQAAAQGLQGVVTAAATNDHRWDCWVSSDTRQTVVSYLIRCIADREIPPEDPPIDSPQALLLDELHDRIHRNESAEIDADLMAGRFNSVVSYIRQIRIHQYPYEESWQQGQPRELVKAVLCKLEPDCPVLLNH